MKIVSFAGGCASRHELAATVEDSTSGTPVERYDLPVDTFQMGVFKVLLITHPFAFHQLHLGAR